MRNWLSQDTPIMRGLNVLADITLLNLHWLVCSLPIFTIGASSAALYQCLFSLERGEPSGSRAFFQAFRSSFRRATLLWLTALSTGAILFVDYRFTFENNLSSHSVLISVYAIITPLLLLTLPFLFTPTALSSQSIPRAFKSSFLLGVAFLPRTLLMLLLWSIPAIWLLLSPYLFWRLAWIWIGFGFGLIAYVCMKLMKKSLKFSSNP